MRLRSDVRSWGRYPREQHYVHRLWDRHQPLPSCRVPMLAHGCGASYGDVCLNHGGVLLGTERLDRFIAFDADAGILACESGITLAQVLALIVPRGWFLPVTPGTKRVTVGGAIANDVHGKNHPFSGTFGHWVRRFELVRSDGQRIVCSRQDNPAWFSATIGGLGLTGLITWAELQLRRIAGEWMVRETLPFSTVNECLSLFAESDGRHEYAVAWLDCSRYGTKGKGMLHRADHAGNDRRASTDLRKGTLSVAVTPPFGIVNAVTVQLLNRAYVRSARRERRPHQVHYDKFFYPLDRLRDWNRLYGPAGFTQVQYVFPRPVASDAIADLMTCLRRQRAGSSLAVLKTFGSRASDGMLSFPREGITITMDFPISGAGTFALLGELDGIAIAAGGAAYPAKDAHMSSTMFSTSFPRAAEFSAYVDPAFSSSFWRRVTR